ncbi:MAG: hypothetical protein GC182_15075 [Rhodopseudomonas sp.]|nr:hypothetical protein [Rhodopseudomonas sp.]
MLSLLSGIVVTGAGGASLWYFMPHNGVVHPIARKPLLDALVPIAIVSAFAIGIALIVSAIV